VPNTSVTTTFTLSDASGAGTTSAGNSVTTVIDHDPAAAPTTAAATVLAIDGNTGRTTGNLNGGHTVKIAVATSEAAAVDTTGGTPRLALSDGAFADYDAAASDATHLVFDYTVGSGENTSDLKVTRLDLNGGIIEDLAGNASHVSDLSGTANSDLALQIDNTAPTTAAATVLAIDGNTGRTSGDLNAGHTVKIAVATSEAVAVDTTGGTPRLALSDGAYAGYDAAASDATHLVFDYSVGSGENTSDLKVTGLDLNGGTIRDLAGNASHVSDLSGTASSDLALQIDTIAPTLASITRADAARLKGGDVRYTVTFQEAVTTPLTGDFAIDPSSTVHGARVVGVTPVAGSGAKSFTVDVAAGTGNGTVTLDLIGRSIKDLAGNSFDSSVPQPGPSYTIDESLNIAPVLAAVAAHATWLPAGPITLSPHVTVSDADDTTLAAATVHVTGGTFAGDGDVLAVAAGGLAGTSIAAHYDAATETLTLSGPDTLAHYSQALEQVTFDTTHSNPTDAGLDPARTVAWQLDDGSPANNLSAIAQTTVDITLARPPANDFNGNGHSDILWQNADGTTAVWMVDGTNLISGSNVGFNPGANWHEIGAGDFNGDGKADILWQNTDGTIAEWFMNGGSVISGGSVAFNPGPAWHAIGTGDFNGDGKADILWQNTDGTPAVWLMNGLNILSGADVGFNPGPSWHVVGAADFNGDGKADILWQNTNGQAAVWLMDGTNLLSGSNVGFNPGPSWHVIGAGDFNGDGKADILWQNTNGQAAVWLMDGTNLLSGANVGFNPGADWHVVGTGDFNGDGKADILWQNINGQAAVWLMNGTSVISGANVGSDPGSNWHVIAQHHDLLV
jgi:hypothetical protein